jgi:hypothetical protein
LEKTFTGLPNSSSSEYRIDFEYEPLVSGAQPHDFLRIRNLRHISSDLIRVEVKHDPDDCLADFEATSGGLSPFYKIESSLGAAPRLGNLASSLFGLISISYAQTTDTIIQLLRSPDRAAVSKRQKALASDPARYLTFINQILGSDSPEDDQVKIFILDALRNYSPRVYKLPDPTLERVLSLTYSMLRTFDRQPAHTL